MHDDDFLFAVQTVGALIGVGITRDDFTPEAVEARKAERAERIATYRRERAERERQQLEMDRPILDAAAEKRARKNAKRLARPAE